jgi:hypothetical protein
MDIGESSVITEEGAGESLSASSFQLKAAYLVCDVRTTFGGTVDYPIRSI